VKIEEVIGKRIREARELDGLSQDQLGRDMGRYLGKPWPNQQVSVAESGGRKFSALELFAVCMVLGRPASYFFLPGTEDVVEVPGPEQRVGADAFAVQWTGRQDPGAVIPQVRAVFAPLMELLEISERTTHEARSIVEEVGRALLTDGKGEYVTTTTEGPADVEEEAKR